MENTTDQTNLSLSTKEWSLLTYIVRTYDVDTAINLVENSNSKNRKRNLLHVTFFDECTKRSKISRNFLNINPCLLTNSQWTLLSNIIKTYDNHSAIPIVQNLLFEQSTYQPKLRFKLNNTLDIIKNFFTYSNLFVKNILPYTIINKNIEEHILQYNIHAITCLNGLFIGRETYLLHNRVHKVNFNIIYSEEMMLITNRLIYQLEHNDILFKLYLIVLLFSTNLSIVSFKNRKENFFYDKLFYQYEKIFSDLLWKYMLYKYDFHECVYRYSMMIKILLDLLKQLDQTEQLSYTRTLL